MILQPLGWLLLACLIFFSIFFFLHAAALSLGWGFRTWQAARRWFGFRQVVGELCSGWALDLSPDGKWWKLEGRNRAGRVLSCRGQLDWLAKTEWAEAAVRAREESARASRLVPKFAEEWFGFRRLAWRVIRLAEDEELGTTGSDAIFPASSNRAGILRLLDSALAGLETLSLHRQSPRRLAEIEKTLRNLRKELLQTTDPTARSTLETTIRTHEERHAHQSSLAQLLPRVRHDLHCLDASLRLAEERLEAAASRVAADQQSLLRPADAALLDLDLPVLAHLRELAKTNASVFRSTTPLEPSDGSWDEPEKSRLEAVQDAR